MQARTPSRIAPGPQQNRQAIPADIGRDNASAGSWRNA